MSIRFQADNDLSRLIVVATLRAEPAIDFKNALAAENRVPVTHDKRTMPAHFAAFIVDGNHRPGVLVVVPRNAPIAKVVESLILIWVDDHPEELANQLLYIPL